MPRPDAEAPGPGARAYHQATKHSWESVRRAQHFLDWEIKPLPFKIYPDAPEVRLPREVAPPAMPALEALARGGTDGRRASLDLGRLAQLLFFSAGLTKKKVYPGGETVHFRAAASTGALYEVEVYVVAGTVDRLAAGVYHFSPGDFTLRRLRAGDHRAALANAAGHPAVASAHTTLILSAIYWRNSWKYGPRAFRHFFWDSGTLLANLLATAVAAEVPAGILLGFADAEVNHLLGLDADREGSVALAPLGDDAPPPPPAAPLPRLELASVPLSSREVDEPLIRQAYAASSLASGPAAAAWRAAGRKKASERRAAPRAASYPLAAPATLSAPPLGEVILRRGSTRQFARAPIGSDELAVILGAAVRDLPLDLPDGGLVDCYLLVHAVTGLPPGAYAFDPAARGLRQLRAGEFRSEGAYLCLEQSLGGDASAVVFFLADLGAALARYGERGYRAVNLVAGLLGGRMYLAAYALGLGASGLTFYDDAVVDFFSPDAEGKDAVFVTALGRAVRRPGADRPPVAAGQLRGLAPGES